VLQTKAGDTIRLDASGSSDPDNDAIGFQWWQQPEIGTAKLTIGDAEHAVTTVNVPADAKGQTLHLVCEVYDQGAFNLRSYQRIIIVIV
jgi:hypothetical protein